MIRIQAQKEVPTENIKDRLKEVASLIQSNEREKAKSILLTLPPLDNVLKEAFSLAKSERNGKDILNSIVSLYNSDPSALLKNKGKQELEYALQVINDSPYIEFPSIDAFLSYNLSLLSQNIKELLGQTPLGSSQTFKTNEKNNLGTRPHPIPGPQPTYILNSRPQLHTIVLNLFEGSRENAERALDIISKALLNQLRSGKFQPQYEKELLDCFPISSKSNPTNEELNVLSNLFGVREDNSYNELWDKFKDNVKRGDYLDILNLLRSESFNLNLIKMLEYQDARLNRLSFDLSANVEVGKDYFIRFGALHYPTYKWRLENGYIRFSKIDAEVELGVGKRFFLLTRSALLGFSILHPVPSPAFSSFKTKCFFAYDFLNNSIRGLRTPTLFSSLSFDKEQKFSAEADISIPIIPLNKSNSTLITADTYVLFGEGMTPIYLGKVGFILREVFGNTDITFWGGINQNSTKQLSVELGNNKVTFSLTTLWLEKINHPQLKLTLGINI
ncbi:MAG: hypothetical protein QXW70_02990 [Candidatus Anstonellales archaeon]